MHTSGGHRAWLALIVLVIEAALGGCVTLDRYTPRVASSALTEAAAKETALGSAWAAAAPADDPSSSAFRLLSSSLEAFAARVAMIDAAERTLDLQYYIFHDDDTGLFLVERMVAAADRGVRVRILVDDMYTYGIEKGLAAFDSHPRIELRIFNPWTQRSGGLVRGLEFLFRPQLNVRMHNKMFIADGVAAILGGRNLADEYFGLDSVYVFRDLDVVGVGPVAMGASRLFDEFWNGPDAIPVTGLRPTPKIDETLQEARTRLAAHRERMAETPYAEAVRTTEFVQQLKTRSLEWVFARGEVVGDAPGKTMRNDGAEWDQSLAGQLRQAVYSAEDEFLICSPYFVPGKDATERLSARANSGVDVRILTNSLAANDVPIAHANYAKYRKDLVRGGVQVFELRRKAISASEADTERRGFGSTDASLHAKTFVVDRAQVFIGSLNLDPRSVVINTEVGVLIHSPVLAGEVAESITTLCGPEWSYRVELTPDGKLTWIGVDADGQEIRFDTDPDTSWWSRFKAGMLGILPLESQS